MLYSLVTTLVFTSLALIGCVAAVYSIVLHKKTSVTLSELREHITQQDKCISMLNSGVVGMGKRILTLENTMEALNQTQQDVNESHADFTYSQARDLIAQGLTNEAVSSNTGLSLPEVNLMSMVYQRTLKAKSQVNSEVS